MIKIRKYVIFSEHVSIEAGIDVKPVLRKVAVAAVVNNPYAGRYSDDLGEIIEFSKNLGSELGMLLVDTIGGPVQSYGKAAIVGADGELEHAHGFLTTVFADGLRAAVGGGTAWIPSSAKRGAMGASIDVPLACKDALFVRSHYDVVTFTAPDAPQADEVAVVVAGANRGRPNFRLGGLRHEDLHGEDGLR